MKGARENRRRDGQSLIIVALHNGSLDPLHQDLTASVMTVVEIRQEKIHGRRIQTSRPVEETEGEKKNRDELSGHMVKYAGSSEINRSFCS